MHQGSHELMVLKFCICLWVQGMRAGTHLVPSPNFPSLLIPLWEHMLPRPDACMQAGKSSNNEFEGGHAVWGPNAPSHTRNYNT